MDINEPIQLAFQRYQTGDLQQAKHICTEILKGQPNNEAMLYLLGVVYTQLEEYDLAIQHIEKLLQFNKSNADAYLALGAIFQKKGLSDEAITYYQKAIEIDPDFAEAYENLGDIFRDKRQLDEAIIYYKKAIQYFPNAAEIYCNLGNIFKEKRQPDLATFYYRKALQFKPDYAEVYNNIGSIFHEQSRLDEAISHYQKALQIDPILANAYYNLGKALRETGDFEEATSCYRKALQINPNLVAYDNILPLLNYNSLYDAQTIFAEHLRFAKQIAEPLHPVFSHYANDRSPSRRLRIGYVSPDFRRHSVSYFIMPVIASHNHERLEIFCYSDVLIPDNITERLKGYADQWRNIANMSNENVAELVLKDRIDILIDLAGHTRDNRMLLFARKPAPVQVSWLGYPNTTGLPTIDYRIVDCYTDPPGLTDPFYTEKLLRLPESFLCYLPEENSPDVGVLPAIEAGHITFGSFNMFLKLTEEVFTLWSEILKKVPDSHLILKTDRFSDKQIYKNVMKIFSQKGINSGRVKLMEYEKFFLEHLNLYNQIDIGLDTFPYNGTTTTCEAIWMGVPVITLAGKSHASRVGTSLLSNIGLADMIAKTYDEYVDIAVKLASDINKLQWLRRELRDMMAHSPLTDAMKFTDNLERCYRTMWGNWCKSL